MSPSTAASPSNSRANASDFTLLLAAHGITDAGGQAAVAAGYGVLHEFLDAFNARDARRWSGTLNYPHVRFAGAEVQIWNSAQDYADTNDLEEFAATGWAYSRWDWVRPVQADASKAHLALQFTRYAEDGTALKSFQALYVVTLQEGHWGIQSRSSYAGIALPGAAF